jgi:hypothetical protein
VCSLTDRGAYGGDVIGLQVKYDLLHGFETLLSGEVHLVVLTADVGRHLEQHKAFTKTFIHVLSMYCLQFIENTYSFTITGSNDFTGFFTKESLLLCNALGAVMYWVKGDTKIKLDYY